jgi:hypothetical protein
VIVKIIVGFLFILLAIFSWFDIYIDIYNDKFLHKKFVLMVNVHCLKVYIVLND